jgi:hypothetical protein
MRFAPLKASAEKNDDKGQAQQPTDNSSVRQSLQVIVVGLLEPVQAIARIVSRVNRAK